MAVMVAVTGVVPLFIALNEAIFPAPLAGRPIPGLSLTQVIALPVPVKSIAAVASPFKTS